MFNFIFVLLCSRVHTLHTCALWCAGCARLRGVDVVVQTVESSADNVRRDALGGNLHVVEFVDLTRAHWVIAQATESPGERSGALHELLVQTLFAQSVQLLGGKLLAADFACDLVEFLLILNDLLADGSVGLGGGGVGDVLGLVVLNDRIVGNNGTLAVLRPRTTEEKRALDEHVPLDTSIALDDPSVNERHEEDRSQNGDTSASAHGDSGDVPRGLLAETKVGRALVDDRQSTDGSGDQEEERRSPDSPRNRVLTNVDNQLDQHEDGRTKASGYGRGHSETSKDSTETLAVVPSPLDLVGTSESDTDTSNGRDERVGRRDVSRVASAPHDPGRGGSESTCESQHLNAGVAFECTVGNDAVLDRVGGTGSDCDGSEKFEACAKDHGLSVGDTPGGDTSGPGVGDIVGTVVVGVQHGKESANDEDVGVFGEHHLDDDLWSMGVDDGRFDLGDELNHLVGGLGYIHICTIQRIKWRLLGPADNTETSRRV